MNHGLKTDLPILDSENEASDIVLVTGGSNGIGAAFVEEMAKRMKGGGKIIVLDISKPKYTTRNSIFFG
jgi:hypothetical protein